MSEFEEELENTLRIEPGKIISPDEAARGAVEDEDDFYGFGEAPQHEPQLQWSWTPFQDVVNDALGIVLAPFRFLLRFMPRG